MLILIFAITLTGCNNNSSSDLNNEKVLAEVNGTNITKEEIDKKITFYHLTLPNYSELVANENLKQQLQSEILYATIDSLLIEEKLNQLGKENTQEEIEENYEKELGGIVDYLFEGDQKKFEETKKEIGLTDSTLEKIFKEDLLYFTFQDYIIKSGTTEEELIDFYEKRKEIFQQPPSTTIKYLLTDTEEKAEQALQQINNENNFEKAIKDFSIDCVNETAVYKKSLEFEDSFIEKVFEANKEEISPIIEDNDYYYIFKVLERKDEHVLEFDEVKESVKYFLVDEKIDNLYEDVDIKFYVEELKRNY